MKRVVLDENVPVQLRRLLRVRHCATLAELGWRGIANGELLARMEGRYDVLVTADRSLYPQQNLSRRAIAIVVLPSNRKSVVLALADAVDRAIEQATPGSCLSIDPSGLISVG